MTIDTPEAKAYLFELYTLTQGDTSVQVSMYDVGTALGLEKNDAGTMAEGLFIQGFAEMKTLSGGIGITRQGMEALDIKMAPEPGSDTLVLGTGTILSDQDRETVDTLLNEIKTRMAQHKMSYPVLDELVMDVKTIEIQMLSPNPKTAVIREVFRSLHDNFTRLDQKDLAEKLNKLISPS